MNRLDKIILASLGLTALWTLVEREKRIEASIPQDPINHANDGARVSAELLAKINRDLQAQGITDYSLVPVQEYRTTMAVAYEKQTHAAVAHYQIFDGQLKKLDLISNQYLEVE